MWMTEQAGCAEGRHELDLNGISELLEIFSTKIQTIPHHNSEAIIGTVGGLVRLLTKKEAPRIVRKFYKHGLFLKLVVAHFIESQSMQLFYIGLSIVKSLLRAGGTERKIMTQIILEYEESCELSQKTSFLDTIWSATQEALEHTSP